MRKSDNRKPARGSSDRPFKAKSGGRPGAKQGDKPYGDRPKKREGGFAGKRERSDADDKPRRRFGAGEERPRRSGGSSFEEKPRRRMSDGERSERPRRSFDDAGERKPYRSAGDKKEAGFDRPRRREGDRDEKPRRSGAGREERSKRGGEEQGERRSFGAFKGARGARANESKGRNAKAERPEERSKTKKEKEREEGSAKRVKFDDFSEGREFSGAQSEDSPRYGKRPVRKRSAPLKLQTEDGLIRLNKYLSNAGVASRREADTLIQSGAVKVNGVVVDQLGYKIKPTDKVTYGDAAVRSERKVYLLLNKPKDYITTTDDPQERKTVMELIAGACKERVYPVGRLDRNTTGLLLFTNDGELATRLMHPKFRIKKVYHASLNKGLKPDDFKALSEGIELEDGPIQADDLAFVGEGKKEIGIEVHSGRNRIVRRMFEHLGYDVLKLDRVAFAGLTKKDLPRGKYRFLSAKEIGFLQMIR